MPVIYREATSVNDRGGRDRNKVLKNTKPQKIAMNHLYIPTLTGLVPLEMLFNISF